MYSLSVNFKCRNMGNVCGNVSWLTKDFKAEGRLSIGSTGHKNMYIGVGLEGKKKTIQSPYLLTHSFTNNHLQFFKGSGLDAKGGIVGGTIELSGIHTSLAIREVFNHLVLIHLLCLSNLYLF